MRYIYNKIQKQSKFSNKDLAITNKHYFFLIEYVFK